MYYDLWFRLPVASRHISLAFSELSVITCLTDQFAQTCLIGFVCMLHHSIWLQLHALSPPRAHEGAWEGEGCYLVLRAYFVVVVVVVIYSQIYTLI